MADKPYLYVCHGDAGGPKMHPCRRVQEALRPRGSHTTRREIRAWIKQQP
jgi:hypothetical protein